MIEPFMEHASPPDLTGTVAGGYRIRGPLGSGTMGHVYEAEDINSGARVALKVLHKHHQKELAPRFLREGKTLALLSHPNIVQLVDMGQLDDGALFLATELVGRLSLRELMDRGRLEQRRSLAIMRQVLDALAAAHDFGVVHRDIKPENIMIAEEGPPDVVKVLDFGVAKLLADTVAGLGEANLTSVGFSIFGSALYIAPESVTGQPVDARLDLYSVGALLYEMLAGRPPFDHEDPSALLRMHAFDPPPTLQQGAPNERFTPKLEQLVARALAKQPDDRYRSATDMIAALDEAVEEMKPKPKPQPRPEPKPAGKLATKAREELDESRPRRQVVDERTHRVAGPRKPSRALAIVGFVLGLAIGGVAVAGYMISTKPESAAAPGQAAAPGESQLAVRAKELMAAGKHQQAIDLVEREAPAQATAADARAFLHLGRARFLLGKRLEAVAAFERALRLAPALGSDSELRAVLDKILEDKSDLLVVLTLDLMAELQPPAHDTIVTYASRGAVSDGRRRAIMLAERDGLASRIDRVESWSLDLQQASSCEDRKRLIEKLVATKDKRALPALKKVRAVKCVEPQATAAIAQLEGP